MADIGTEQSVAGDRRPSVALSANAVVPRAEDGKSKKILLKNKTFSSLLFSSLLLLLSFSDSPELHSVEMDEKFGSCFGVSRRLSL